MAAVVERADTALVDIGCLTMLLAAAAVTTGVGEWAAADADTGAGDALDADEVRLLLGGSSREANAFAALDDGMSTTSLLEQHENIVRSASAHRSDED
jgi:hypothetical protein